MWTKVDPHKWDIISSLRGNMRYQLSLSSRRPEIPWLKTWLSQTEYPISENYYRNHYNRDRNIKLEDVARVVALFSEVSPSDPK